MERVRESRVECSLSFSLLVSTAGERERGGGGVWAGRGAIDLNRLEVKPGAGARKPGPGRGARAAGRD